MAKALKEAYPSSPTRLPMYGLRIVTAEGGFIYEVFHAKYAAKKHLDLIINDRPVRWLDNRTLRVDNLTITGEGKDDLEEIMEHEYTAQEQEWEIPEPHRSVCLRLAGIAPSMTTPEPAEPRQRTTRKPTGGDDSIMAAHLAEELNIDPSKLRQQLRKLGIEKPYAWSRATADDIKKKIKK